MNQRRKLEVAVYLSVALIATILAIIGIFFLETPWQDLLLNVSADFIGVAILFFFVNRFFGINQEDEENRKTELFISMMEKKLSDTSLVSPSMVMKKLENLGPLSKSLANARKIYFVGASLNDTLRSSKNQLIKLAKNDCQIRLITVDPHAFPNEERHKRLIKQQSMDLIKDLINQTSKNDVKVKLLNRYPPFTLKQIEYSTPGKGIIQLTIFSYQGDKSERPTITLQENRDSDWYHYFSNMVQRMWKDGQALE
ncbi:MAG: hypothetical protein KC449_14280 [Anaerolineales bacterium]|nr:hypothetical protein [Anaerolineales bacterium]